MLSPHDILQLLSQQIPGFRVDILRDIFPSCAQLDGMLDRLSPDPNDPSLAILDDLLPTTPSQTSKGKIKTPKSTDRRGFSTYARVVDGIAQVFLENRQLAKRNLWVLRHLLALSIYAQDLRNVPNSFVYASPAFDGKISETSLDGVLGRVKQLSVYLFNVMNATGVGNEGGWRLMVVEKFLSGKDTSREGLSDPQRLLFDLILHAKRQDAVRDARVLKVVLEALLADGVSDAEADLWIQLAKKVERNGLSVFPCESE